MIYSEKELSAAYELTWSLGAGGGDHGDTVLKFEYKVRAFEEIYVTDRLWDYDKNNRRVPDPFGIYRFVRNGSLRLVLGQAPPPGNVMPQIVFKPLCSRVLAGETHQMEVLLTLPIDEYSSLGRNINAQSVVEKISLVYFVLGYRQRSSMKSDPVPPLGETAEEAGYIVHDTKPIISLLEVDTLPVKRRTGYMARFALPGEPEPGPAPTPD